MQQKRGKSSIVRGAVIGRANFIELLMVALLLAMGVNLISDHAPALVGFDHVTALVTGLTLCLASIAYLGTRVFGGWREARSYQGFIVYDESQNEVIHIPRYELGECIPMYLEAAFAENEALQTLWHKEPLRDVWSHETNSSTGVARPLKSVDLLSEAVEYFLLDELCTHLTDYFNDPSFRKQNLKLYNREDVPEILLSNRFLELFSRPPEQRSAFVDLAIQEKGKGQVVSAINSSGAIYSRFDLVLPKGSAVRRPRSWRIEFETSRMTIGLQVGFEGLSALLPGNFSKWYLGIEDWENFQAYQVSVDVDVTLKFGALLTPLGWEYYQWVDSFLESVERDVSQDAFFETIGWQYAQTVLDSMAVSGGDKLDKASK